MTAADPTLHTLVERLRRLEEMEIARNHLHRYAATLDNPTPEAVAALFTDDGILRTGRGTAVGRTSIADFYRRLLERDPSEKRHFITSPHTTWLAPGLVEIASYFLFTGRGTNRSVLGWGTGPRGPRHALGARVHRGHWRASRATATAMTSRRSRRWSSMRTR